MSLKNVNILIKLWLCTGGLTAFFLQFIILRNSPSHKETLSASFFGEHIYIVYDFKRSKESFTTKTW